jgi:phenylacetate-coenzyme A ligase PaaK-like adenylate-forming protein
MKERHAGYCGHATWTNKNTTHGPMKKWNLLQPKWDTCANKNLTSGTTGTRLVVQLDPKTCKDKRGPHCAIRRWHMTRTISNATGYSMYTWKASPTKAPASVAAPRHACQNSSIMVSFSSQIKPLLWRVSIFVTEAQVWRDFYDEMFFFINSS